MRIRFAPALALVAVLIWAPQVPLPTPSFNPDDVAASTFEPRPWIESVHGSAADGWAIVWRTDDGGLWREHTPTRSEELAECGAYAAPARRARCATEVRTRHRWVATVARTLAHH